jgi:hypothetical protein
MLHWLQTLIITIWTALRRLWRRSPSKHFPEVLYMGGGEDPKPALRRNRFIIVGTRERPKWAKFMCPCGCGDVLSLNLMKSHHPNWQVTLETDGSVTVFPSVDATSCNSHFWIRASQIVWT